MSTATFSFPFAWYWIADDNRVYASAKQSIVTVSDEAFTAFKAEDNLPTRWPVDGDGNQTEAALQDVLSVHGLRLFPPALDEVKADLMSQIDSQAERERLKWITPGAGQAMTYQMKIQEAERLVSDPSPDPLDYPLLAAEVGISGDTLNMVADTVSAQYRAWVIVGAAIEAVRLRAKKAIGTAESAFDANQIFSAVNWPS